MPIGHWGHIASSTARPRRGHCLCRNSPGFESGFILHVQDTGCCWIPAFALPELRPGMLDAGYWILDAGCRMPDAGYQPSLSQSFGPACWMLYVSGCRSFFLLL